MRLSHSLLFSLALALAGSTTAQANVVVNSGFTTNTAGWNLNPTVRSPQIVPTSISGEKSPGLRFLHYSGSVEATVQQTLQLNAQLYRIRAFAGANLPPGNSVAVRAWLHNLRTNQQHVTTGGFMQNRTSGMQFQEVILDALPRIAITADRYSLTIGFIHRGATLQPCACEVDRFELTEARMPITLIDQVVSTPGNQAILTTWTTGNKLVIQGLSLKRAGTPIAIPGIEGWFELDPSVHLTFTAQIRNGSSWSTKLPVWPTSALGLPFYAQSFCVDTRTFAAILGSSSWHAIH